MRLRVYAAEYFNVGTSVPAFLKDGKPKRVKWCYRRKLLSIDIEAGSIPSPKCAGKFICSAFEGVRAVKRVNNLALADQNFIDDLSVKVISHRCSRVG